MRTYGPQIITIRHGWEDKLERLIQSGDADVNDKLCNMSTSLSYAASYGYERTVKVLINISFISADASNNDDYAYTPFIWAAWKDDENIVKILIDSRKVDVNKRNAHGKTALTVAKGKGHDKVVHLLLDSGQVSF